MSKTDQSLVKVVNFRFDMNSIEDSIGEVKTSKFSICHPRATQPFDEITTIWNIVVTIGKFKLNSALFIKIITWKSWM